MGTDAELIFWAVALVAGIIAFGVLWFMAKRESENYVDWVRDWE